MCSRPFLVLFLALCHPLCFSAAQAGESVPVWQPVELSFEARPGDSHPLSSDFRVEFSGPDRRSRVIPGFWDGGSVWKARLAAESEGEWSWRTKCSDIPELDGHTGTFTAGPAKGSTLLQRHGGFLRVSQDRRHLTYSDGTPFFWLGDTVWTFPTDATPLEPDPQTGASMLGEIFARRKEQGYTVIQAGFIRGATGNLDRNDPLSWNSDDMAFWHRADRRMQAAGESGFVIALTSNWSREVQDYPLDALKLKWRHLVARYAAYPVVWIVSGEYNMRNWDKETVDKVMVLGTYIKGLDPFERAMTVHPWAVQFDDRQAWNADWNDFIMIQGGHRLAPSVFAYLDPFMRPDPKPVLESECDYEGMFEVRSTADQVRHSAYRAIQNGSFGFTYGALGLWNANPEPADPGKWGVPTRWQDALAFPGGEHMGFLKSCYERLDWWKLEPRPGSAWPDEHTQVHVKAIGNQAFIIYFEAGIEPDREMNVSALPGTGRFTGDYTAEWFDPRTGAGESWEGGRHLRLNWAGDLTLPSRPDSRDWVLIIRLDGRARDPAPPLPQSG